MKKRDILLLLGGVIIVVFLWMAPKSTTAPLPKDETHQPMYDAFHKDGKKAAGKLCEECHNDDGVLFPAEHPTKMRCLLCHKVQLD